MERSYTSKDDYEYKIIKKSNEAQDGVDNKLQEAGIRERCVHKHLQHSLATR